VRWTVLALTVVACQFDTAGGGLGTAGGAGGMAGVGGGSGVGGSGGIGGGSGTGGMSGTGGSAGMMVDAARPDAAVIDAPMIDAPTGPCASVNQRVCISSTQSGHCDNLLMPVADRNCPPTSMCSNGTCRPPSGAQSCTHESDCGITTACVLYTSTNGNSIIGACTPNDGNGSLYDNCNNGNQCQSGTCASANTFPDQCYYACRMDMECPMGGHCVNVTAPATLEGTATTGVKGCFK
jgi:hypothetical protein